MKKQTQTKPTTLGERIQVCMDALDMPLFRLSIKSEVQEQTLSTWISNRSKPGAEMLARVAQTLNTTSEWLCFGETKSKKGPKR